MRLDWSRRAYNYLDLAGLAQSERLRQVHLYLADMEGGVEPHHLQLLVVHPRKETMECQPLRVK